jgi:uncharacterized protein YlaI
MSEKKIIPSEGKHGKVQPPQNKPPDKKPAEGPNPANPISDLQHQVGNRAVQRLIAQRQTGPAETDEATANEINQMRGSGQSLDGSVQREMGAKMGADFSGVNVHTSPQADDLNQRLGARAFTTGQDIFFRQGEYSPNSDGGKELLAHELTHVVQQRKGGDLEPAAKLVVNPPDDVYEREADQVAKQVTAPASVQAQEEEEDLQAKRLQNEPIQRQAREEEEEEELQAKRRQSEPVQRQAREEEEEEELQAKRLQSEPVQRQEMPEEEEELQAKRLESQLVQRQEEEELAMPKAIQRASDLEEEEPLQGKWLQRQEMEEEELIQGKRLENQPLQRQEDEELVMPKVVQRREIEEEEELQAKRLQREPIQRQEMPEEEEELQAKRLQTKPFQRQDQKGPLSKANYQVLQMVPVPEWVKYDLPGGTTVYHVTSAPAAENIKNQGINDNMTSKWGEPYLGQGFYTHTNLNTADAYCGGKIDENAKIAIEFKTKKGLTGKIVPPGQTWEKIRNDYRVGNDFLTDQTLEEIKFHQGSQTLRINRLLHKTDQGWEEVT